MPLIGITCDSETITDRRGVRVQRYVSPKWYADAVVKAGADVVLIPYLATTRLEAVLAHLDGLVISGGDLDVPPSFYGDVPRSGLRGVIEERSAFERDLCRAALERRLPLLGVCGGMQLLNVVAGGTLYQDLSERPGTEVHEQPHDKRKPSHAVDLVPGTLLARVYAAPRIEVNSTHHQIVKELGRGVRAAAHSPDGVIEAIEMEALPFALGVQWHPEALDDETALAVYRALVQATSRGRTG